MAIPLFQPRRFGYDANAHNGYLTKGYESVTVPGLPTPIMARWNTRLGGYDTDRGERVSDLMAQADASRQENLGDGNHVFGDSYGGVQGAGNAIRQSRRGYELDMMRIQAAAQAAQFDRAKAMRDEAFKRVDFDAGQAFNRNKLAEEMSKNDALERYHSGQLEVGQQNADTNTDRLARDTARFEARGGLSEDAYAKKQEGDIFDNAAGQGFSREWRGNIPAHKDGLIAERAAQASYDAAKAKFKAAVGRGQFINEAGDLPPAPTNKKALDQAVPGRMELLGIKEDFYTSGFNLEQIQKRNAALTASIEAMLKRSSDSGFSQDDFGNFTSARSGKTYSQPKWAAPTKRALPPPSRFTVRQIRP